MKIWALCRKYDRLGSGNVQINVTTAIEIFQRSSSTVRRYLRDAKKSGLIRDYFWRGGWIKIYYTSIEKAAAIAGLSEIGPIANVHISQLKNSLSILATEVEAEHLQNQAFYTIKHGCPSGDSDGVKIRNADKSSLVEVDRLLHSPSDKLPGVLERGDRFTIVSEDFTPWGGSQGTLAVRRGVSVRTIQRHLSNEYRLDLTPIRQHRRAVTPIVKTQILQKVPDQFRAMISQKFYSEESPRLILYRGKYYFPRCNIYGTDAELRRKLWRRKSYQKIRDSYWSEKNFRGGNFNKFDLSIEGKN